MEMSIKSRNKFINNNMGIIGSIADGRTKNTTISFTKLAESKGYTRTDIINSGVVGMINGIDRFDETKGVPLKAFVRIEILRRISEFIAKPRKHDRLENRISMQTKISNNNSGDSVTIEDMLKSKTTTDSFGINIDIDAMKKVMSSNILSDVERLVINMRFIKDMKFREMDAKLRVYLNNPKAKSFYFLNIGLKKLQKALA